jgi:hypothetical protein
MDILHCKTPEMIKKEILMHFIAYNCIRRVMLLASLSKVKQDQKISFKSTLQVIRQFSFLMI